MVVAGQRQGMKAESFAADTKGECQFWASSVKPSWTGWR
jgi:hypothetical protein